MDTNSVCTTWISSTPPSSAGSSNARSSAAVISLASWWDGVSEKPSPCAALPAQRRARARPRAQRVGVAPAAEPPVAGHDEDRRATARLRLAGQRMIDLSGPADHGLHRAGDLPGIRRRLLGPLLCLDDPRRRDQLLGTRDLGGGLD